MSRIIVCFILLFNAAATEAADLSDAEVARRLRMPNGFEVRIFARGLNAPRFMAVGPDGMIYVSLPSAGSVARLREGGEGQTARVERVAQGLDRAHGLTFYENKLYVAGTQKIWRVDRLGGDGSAGAATPIVSGLPDGGHSTRTILFGADGKMYVSIGSSCNVCREKDPRRAAIVRYNRDGGGEEIFAAGLRNSVGLAWHPTTKELWGTDNGRDLLGDDSPPDEINIIREGQNYGWPDCYADRVADPEFGTAEICQKTDAPTVKLQAHSAPLGLAFYTGKQFPREYQGNLFVALHGSWNRSKKTGYKVVRVKIENGRPGQVQDFITGWLTENETVWGRPVDLVVGKDGALYLSDDADGVVYRLSYRGQ